MRTKVQNRMAENRGASVAPEPAGGRARPGDTTPSSCSGRLSVFSFQFSAFTLLEVLVALAIFAMAAVVLGATYVNALNAYQAAGRQNEYDADLRFVRAVLLAEPDRQKATDGGDLDLGGNKHAHWQADIAATDTVDLFSVAWTCDIVDPARPKSFHTSQTFMLLRPTWSDPVERTKLLDQVKQRILEMQGAAP